MPSPQVAIISGATIRRDADTPPLTWRVMLVMSVPKTTAYITLPQFLRPSAIIVPHRMAGPSTRITSPPPVIRNSSTRTASTPPTASTTPCGKTRLTRHTPSLRLGHGPAAQPHTPTPIAGGTLGTRIIEKRSARRTICTAIRTLFRAFIRRHQELARIKCNTTS